MPFDHVALAGDIRARMDCTQRMSAKVLTECLCFMREIAFGIVILELSLESIFEAMCLRLPFPWQGAGEIGPPRAQL